MTRDKFFVTSLKDYNGGTVVHSWFMDLSNLVEIVVHHLLIGGITYLSRRDGFPMVSTLVYVIDYYSKSAILWLVINSFKHF